MKIIQSLWTAGKNLKSDSFGWPSCYYHLISWSLSVNLLVKLYDDVELYTDAHGYKVLIEELELPYTKVHVVLDDLNEYPSHLWAVSKIKVYSMQDAPFIHLDGDVFIWKEISSEFFASDVVAQNLESITEYYQSMWDGISKHVNCDCVDSFLNTQKLPEFASNMGLIGGSNTQVFKNYAAIVLEFLESNKQVWDELKNFDFNVFFEQVLFHQFVVKNGIKIDYIFNSCPDDDQYIGFGDFDKINGERWYLHLLGDYKNYFYSLGALEFYLIKEFPNIFSKLIKFLDCNKYGFVKNYDFGISNYSDFFFEKYITTNPSSWSDNKQEYLFFRNLAWFDIINLFDTALEQKDQIILFKLPCNRLIKEHQVTFLEVEDFEDVTIVPVDHIDILILELLNTDVSLISLKDEIFDMVSDEILDCPIKAKQFDTLLIDRIRYFVTRKIVYVK